MKQKIKSIVGSIVLMLILLISMVTPVFAADTQNVWVKKASLITQRYYHQTEVLNGKIYLIGGLRYFDANTSTDNSVEEYDPATDKWSLKASMISPRTDFQTVEINGKIYALGGFDGKYIVPTVEEYDPSTNKWTLKAPMTNAREYFQVEVVGGKIYVMGGCYGNYLSSVEVYDPSTNKWTTLESMPTAKAYFRTAVVDEKIYAIGGNDGKNITSTVFEYDPVTNKWTPKKSMSVSRNFFSTAVIDGKIYAIGGDGLSSVEMYDPVANVWTPKKSMSISREYFETEVVNGEIYAMGGCQTQLTGYLSSVEKYNPISNTWSLLKPMSTPRLIFQTEVLNGNIYAMGGFYTNLVLSTVEAYQVTESTSSTPTLTVTASSNKVKVGQQFTTAVAIHNGTNICAEDIKITYDKDLFTYAGAEAQDGLKIYKEDTSVPGTVRFISACEGKDNAATGDKGLITLKFTAKKEGTGKVDIVQGRIADNATLEMDVAEANCGEDTITVEGYGDVNKTGEFTLLDLGIDGWYHGMNAADTDTARFNADIVADGKIDDNDLAEITKGILANSNYPLNNTETTKVTESTETE